MQHNTGASLVEMLVSMTILVVVLGMATAGVAMALRVHRTQEAVTSSQTKLRRVNEAVNQEIRGAVLGGLTSTPYSASNSSVSFTVMDGGAGYEVSNTTASQVTFIATENSAEALDFGSGKALLVDGNGTARILHITSNVSARPNQEFVLTHTPCSNTFPSTNALLFKISTVGFNYNATEDILYQKIDGANALPLAFDLTEFTIGYVYQRADGSTHTELTPYVDSNGIPLRVWTDSLGNAHTLVRLELQMSTEARTSVNSTVDRSYSGQVELLGSVNGNQNRIIQGVSPCS